MAHLAAGNHEGDEHIGCANVGPIWRTGTNIGWPNGYLAVVQSRDPAVEFPVQLEMYGGAALPTPLYCTGLGSGRKRSELDQSA